MEATNELKIGIRNNEKQILETIFGKLMIKCIDEKACNRVGINEREAGRTFMELNNIKSFDQLKNMIAEECKKRNKNLEESIFVLGIIKTAKDINDDICYNADVDDMIYEEDLLDKKIKYAIDNLNFDFTKEIKDRIVAVLKKNNEEVEKAQDELDDKIKKIEGEDDEPEDDNDLSDTLDNEDDDNLGIDDDEFEDGEDDTEEDDIEEAIKEKMTQSQINSIIKMYDSDEKAMAKIKEMSKKDISVDRFTYVKTAITNHLTEMSNKKVSFVKVLQGFKSTLAGKKHKDSKLPVFKIFTEFLRDYGKVSGISIIAVAIITGNLGFAVFGTVGGMLALLFGGLAIKYEVKYGIQESQGFITQDKLKQLQHTIAETYKHQTHRDTNDIKESVRDLLLFATAAELSHTLCMDSKSEINDILKNK